MDISEQLLRIILGISILVSLCMVYDMGGGTGNIIEVFSIIMRQVFNITHLLGRIESVSEVKVWRVALAFQLYLISSEFVWRMLTHSLHLA